MVEGVKQIATKLSRDLDRVRKGLEASRALFDHIEEVGWINGIYPAATYLRLDVNPLERFRTLTRPGGIADIRAELRDRIIPKKLNRLESLENQLSELVWEDESTSPRGKELLQREQIFTQEQATIIASAVTQKRGVVFLAPNRSELFTFDIDDYDKKQVEPAIDEISHFEVDPQLSQLNSGQREELRKRTLDDLNFLLSSRDLLNKTFDANKVNPTMQTFLLWLFEQNDKYGGRLCELLSLPAEYEPTQLWRGYNTEGTEIVRPARRFVILPADLSLHIRKYLQRYLEQHPLREVVEPEEEEDLSQDQDERGMPYEEAGEQPSIHLFIPGDHQEQPRLRNIQRRDPEVRQKIEEYLDQIAQHNITGPVSPARANQAFQRLKKSVVQPMEEKRYIRPQAGRDGYPVFTPKEIALMLYVYDHSYSMSLTRSLVSELDEMIEEAIRAREQAKRNQPAPQPNNHNGNHH